MVASVSGILSIVLGCVIFVCFIFLALVYLTDFRLRLKDVFTGGNEADTFRRGQPTDIELTARDLQLVANGWHPDDVMTARRNGLELPDKPGY